MKPVKTPKNLDLDITNRCNLRCSYCAHFDSAGDVDQDLELEEWLTFFRELNDCAVMAVCLSGGEPLIRGDFQEIVRGVVENRMRFSINTNGTLLNRDVLEFIRSTGRCDSIQVSIDGPGPEAHDRCRGDGSFARALAGLRLLKESGVSATVRVTIHRYNYRSLPQIAELLLDDVGLSGFSTNAASHLGMCVRNADSIALNAEEYSEAIRLLFELNEARGGRIGAQAGPLASGRHWCEMEAAMAQRFDGLPNCGYLRSCGGVFSKMAVRADGVMVPCSQLSHMEMGRINRDNLREVWTHHPHLLRLRERQNIPLSQFEHCAGCAYTAYCRGGCPALAYTLSGDENVPSPDSCYRLYKEAGGVLPESVLTNLSAC